MGLMYTNPGFPYTYSLENLRLKSTALDGLDLPFIVRHGRIGSVVVRIPGGVGWVFNRVSYRVVWIFDRVS